MLRHYVYLKIGNVKGFVTQRGDQKEEALR